MSRPKRGESLIAGDATPAAAGTPGAVLGAEAHVLCPFAVLVDTREQKYYTFEGMHANADKGGKLIKVPLKFEALQTGDYSILGLPGVVVERKSKEDLFQSVSQARENFEDRLRRMCQDHSVAAVVVEAEWSEILSSPPAFTKFSSKALWRSVAAWMVRWPMVHWVMMPGRRAAEVATFRFLEKAWECHKQGRWYDQETGLAWLAKGGAAHVPVVRPEDFFGPVPPGATKDGPPACPRCGQRKQVAFTDRESWLCVHCEVEFTVGGPGPVPEAATTTTATNNG